MNKLIFTLILLSFSSFNSIYSQRSAKEFSELKQKELKSKTIEKDTTQTITRLPEFPGGTEGLFKYLGKKLKYPKSARKDSISGQVYVEFIVDKNGEIGEIVVTKGLSEDLDNEAVRVIRSMPKWTPGQQNGENIDMIYRMPILFIQ